jgi:adenylate cyclase
MISQIDILNARILIVDDKKVNVLLLERMLSNAGYRSVTGITISNDVYELHRVHRYDLILLDLEMPGLDGFQVMEQLKEVETEGYLPVLVLTAQPEHKLRALKAGARDFVSKPFDLAEVLIRVRNMIEVRLLHLETKMLFAQVTAEKKISERLLLNVLPHAIAERLKGILKTDNDSITEIIADSFKDVTVLFADIVGFTKYSEGVSADVMVHVLNDIFTQFDAIADHRGLEKIKTIGDAYMAVAGLPDPVDDHADRAALMALDMIDVMDRFNEQRACNLKIRVGISSGEAVAGVIGKRKFLYDLWGEVVNTASRMESHGVSGRIQLNDATRRKLNETFVMEHRGAINVKDMGEIDTWFLNGRGSCDADDGTLKTAEMDCAPIPDLQG